jgi:hypothetical protein
MSRWLGLGSLQKAFNAKKRSSEESEEDDLELSFSLPSLLRFFAVWFQPIRLLAKMRG